MTGCSSDMTLARLLGEQLDEADHVEIADHVESCVRCQERLKELTCDCSGFLDWDPIEHSSTDPWLTGDRTRSGSQALDACDAAQRIDPKNDKVQLYRVGALLELKREQEAIDACDAYCREAVTDAEESLRHGELEGRLHYSGARILALAAESAKKAARPRDPSEMDKVQNYQDRALALLGQAVERAPLERCARFWREVVRSDHAFPTIRRQLAFARIAAAACQPHAQ